jgi:hypothetical protein
MVNGVRLEKQLAKNARAGFASGLAMAANYSARASAASTLLFPFSSLN